MKEYTWITLDVVAKHSYLGMQIKFQEDCVTIDMIHYIETMLASLQNEKEYSTPANKDIFVVDEKAKVLTEAERKRVHTLVAKLLFLSKRARPEISMATSFLCTRVTKAMEEDKRKLFHLMGFLHGTRKHVMELHPKDNLNVVAYIDASFAPHPDAKLHSGVAIFVGGALTYVDSRKQKCITKSPTESDLVALTDYIGLVELFAEFVAFATDSPVTVPVIYQDSTSFISVVTRGGGIMSTKHLRV